MRLFGVGVVEKKNEIGPLSAAQLAELPLVLFIPVDPVAASAADVDTASALPQLEAGAPHVVSGKNSRRFWRLWKNKSSSAHVAGTAVTEGITSGSSGIYISPPVNMRYHEITDHLSTCAICLLGACIHLWLN